MPEKYRMKTNTLMKDVFGWKQSQVSGLSVWFKGYLLNMSLESELQKILDLAQSDLMTIASVCSWANQLRGHFALVVESDAFSLAVVDKDRSIPLFYSSEEAGSLISNHAPDLKQRLQLNISNVNQQAALELAMSGYTIGSKSLYNPISQLVAGSCVLVQAGKLEVASYYDYRPWNLKDSSESVLKSELSELSWNMMQDMVNSLDNRQVVVPLSAGNDSRLVVSLLKELNYKDVHCISYGLKDNYEAQTAQQIADKLGYQWSFIPLSLKIQKCSFAQQPFKDFLHFADSLTNGPILIDYTVINHIKNSKLVADDAVFINGNSGDFISGAHIGAYMPEGGKADIDWMVSKYIDKHYALWRCLKTDSNRKKIAVQLKSHVTKILEQNSLPLELVWAAGENMEWIGRQTKLVSATQRSYEFHGYEWRLPLWDPVFMDFWEGVPREYKLKQKLYTEVLKENNWGGVWQDIKVNDHRISSVSISLLRTMAKIPFVLLGKQRWHDFDKRFFGYFLDNTAATAYVPYLMAFLDSCGARNRNSWITRDYLAKHGVDLPIDN